MSVLDIRIYGDPILRAKGREMGRDELTPAFRELIESMAETMYGANGIGLAATQVGDMRRFFIADVDQVEGEKSKGRRVKNPDKRKLQVFINPEILESSTEDEPYNEGCLSIPELEADVFRPVRVRVRYRDGEWNEKTGWIDELLARVFQHELDHLDGVLFIDRIPAQQRIGIAGQLNRLKRRTEERLDQAASA